MTPKEKADEIFEKFENATYIYFTNTGDGVEVVMLAKHSALIAVDETIKTLNEDIRDIDVRGNILLDLIDYWREVKQEIEKL